MAIIAIKERAQREITDVNVGGAVLIHGQTTQGAKSQNADATNNAETAADGAQQRADRANI